MIAAGVLTSGERLILAPIVGAAILTLWIGVAALSGLLARHRWRRDNRLRSTQHVK
jgi:hypothetical protein